MGANRTHTTLPVVQVMTPRVTTALKPGFLQANVLNTPKGNEMTIPLDAPEVLNREFLQIRAKLLEIAASLDRLDRADGTMADDYRMQQIQAAMAITADGQPARAERVQMAFSLPYDTAWQDQLKIGRRS